MMDLVFTLWMYRFNCISYNPLATIDDGTCYYGQCQIHAPIEMSSFDGITDNRATVIGICNSNTCKVLISTIDFEVGNLFLDNKIGRSRK